MALLHGADELWVYANPVSEGMAGEIAEAMRLGVTACRIDVGPLLSRVGGDCTGLRPHEARLPGAPSPVTTYVEVYPGSGIRLVVRNVPPKGTNGLHKVILCLT